MPSRRSAESLAERIVAFVDAASDEREPERDIAAADAICHDIIETWPSDEAGWGEARAALAHAVAVRLDQPPAELASALHLVALYLDDIRLDTPHPRSDAGALRVAGQQKFTVRFQLTRAVAAQLIARLSPDQLTTMCAALNEWHAWIAVAEAFSTANASLTPIVITSILAAAIAFSASDGAADKVIGPLLEGLAASASAVDEIIEAWLAAEAPHVGLDLGILWHLVRWRLPHRTNHRTIRGRLVHQLARMADERAQRIALFVTLRTWPATTRLEERRALLFEALDRIGSGGVPAALSAIAHDPLIAEGSRFDALPLFDAVVARADEVTHDVASASLWVLQWVARQLTDDSAAPEDVDALLRRLPLPSAIAPDRTRPLDWLLRRLVVHDVDRVKAYILDWLEAQHVALAQATQPIQDHLPLTAPKLTGDGWLIRAAASTRAALRVVALRCLVDPYVGIGHRMVGGPRHFAVPDQGYDTLTGSQVLGLAHLILGQSVLGEATIDLLFALARARIDCLPELLPLLAQPAMQTYPGRHERAVELWSEAVTARPEDDPERGATAHLEREVELRRRGFEARGAVSPVVFLPTRYAARAVGALFERQMQEAMRSHRSPLLELATRVPLACGGASAFDAAPDAESPTPLKAFGTEFEQAALEGYDPIAARYARLYHLEQASRLLDGPSSTS